MIIKYTLTALAATTIASEAAIVYQSDFQSDAIGTVPTGWTATVGGVRAFRTGGATSEGGVNDTALIGTGVNFTAVLDLGRAGVIGETLSVHLDVGQYASSGTSTVFWQLGTLSGGVFTGFSEAAITAGTSGLTSWTASGTGNQEFTGVPYSHVFHGADSTGNLALQVGSSAGTFGGVDSVVVSSVPEPTSTILIGMSGLALFTRRRK